jgi:hypothetical protein
MSKAQEKLAALQAEQEQMETDALKVLTSSVAFLN